MAKYSCFWHPRPDFDDHELEDPCPVCKRPYGTPIFDPPPRVADFEILEAVGRGFYSAAYRTEAGRLRVPRLLKVAPIEVYELFQKNFAEECRLHLRVAQDSEHIVPIVDFFDTSVDFPTGSLECHVALLDFIQGRTLEDHLSSGLQLPLTWIAQIATDLFRIIAAFEGRSEYHNDLHAGNVVIQELQAGGRRPDATEPTIRAVAIDLGSVGDRSKSDPYQERLSDIHWVAGHLRRLVEHLLLNPEEATDLEYRLASVLDERAQLMTPASLAMRKADVDECVLDISEAVQQVASPWSIPPKLRQFKDYYNAQTLAAWYVPHLLVDPEETWLKAISAPGPQIITGMRGCGKTMLLRALEFHARASKREDEDYQAMEQRLARDGYCGLYVSATRLLDRLGSRDQELTQPFERLYVAYSLAALRAVRHLREVAPNSVTPRWHQQLAVHMANYLEGIIDTSPTTDFELERRLIKAGVDLSRGRGGATLEVHPSQAFPELAVVLRKASSLWSNASILYLLDDVSTRYLEERKIQELLSALLFQDPTCAFKLTSEAQTLELVLQSPGLVETARAGRDYEVFDLGSQVYERVKSRDKAAGKTFVEQILQRRARYYAHHPKALPQQLLGDTSLEEIARRIASTTASSAEKKEVYYGLTALARTCVGDIGDVISLYDLILQTARGQGWPIAPRIQSEAYQKFCSRRLYELNRRKGELKDFAITFAEASHELLVKSYNDLAARRSTRNRLRQYLTVYVRLTSGDVAAQYERLRDLIDAGVFVFGGGSDAPRTKTRDSDPLLQFKLTYRKIYGLSNFIGLAESDRFELSGDQLQDWLEHPEDGKEILLRNLGPAESAGPSDEDETDRQSEERRESEQVDDVESNSQPSLFEEEKLDWPDVVLGSGTDLADQPRIGEEATLRLPALTLRTLSFEEFQEFTFDSIVCGLGFEERTLESVRRVTNAAVFRNAITIKYGEAGQSAKIRGILRRLKIGATNVAYDPSFDGRDLLRDGTTLIDVTGLAKPALFHFIRQALLGCRRVWLSYTEAEKYYPLDERIAGVLRAEDTRDQYELLELLPDLLTGEEGPYTAIKLLETETDDTRRRALFGFASPKHERLLHLLEARDFDRIEIVVPPADGGRARLARLVGEIAARNFASAKLVEFSSNNLRGVMAALLRSYQEWYVDGGFNFEVGLTGSKLQAVAVALASAQVKFSQCWYVSPSHFDPARFTEGVGKTHILEISLGTD